MWYASIWNNRWMDRWMNQAYSRPLMVISTTHGHITDCKLVCMCWTRLVLVRPVASLYSASPLKLGTIEGSMHSTYISW